MCRSFRAFRIGCPGLGVFLRTDAFGRLIFSEDCIRGQLSGFTGLAPTATPAAAAAAAIAALSALAGIRSCPLGIEAFSSLP